MKSTCIYIYQLLCLWKKLHILTYRDSGYDQIKSTF